MLSNYNMVSTKIIDKVSENCISFYMQCAKGYITPRLRLFYCSPNQFSNFWGAILPCFAVAPPRGERNGNKIVIDVPEKCCVLIQKINWHINNIDSLEKSC